MDRKKILLQKQQEVFSKQYENIDIEQDRMQEKELNLQEEKEKLFLEIQTIVKMN